LRELVKIKNKKLGYRKHQRGAALIVGLLLLVVITILAMSGINTATTELAMARNDQTYEYAFQSAEKGLESALGQGEFSTANPIVVTPATTTNEVVSATILFEGTTIVPDKAFSLGVGSGIAAYHFLATSQAGFRFSPGSETDRDASATHTQAFYIVGPELSGL
jgi:type IV pilus assembly protein PilX